MYRPLILPGIELEKIESRLLADPLNLDCIGDIFEYLTDHFELEKLPRLTEASPLDKHTSDINNYVDAPLFSTYWSSGENPRYLVRQEFLRLNVPEWFALRKRRLSKKPEKTLPQQLYRAFEWVFDSNIRERRAREEATFFKVCREHDWRQSGLYVTTQLNLEKLLREAAFNRASRELVMEGEAMYPHSRHILDY